MSLFILSGNTLDFFKFSFAIKIFRRFHFNLFRNNKKLIRIRKINFMKWNIVKSLNVIILKEFIILKE